MMKNLLTLLVAALCFASCISAPLSTTQPAPASPDSPPDVGAPANEGDGVSATSLADVEDVMMDPTAKLPWQKQEGDITYLTDKFLLPEDPDDPFLTLPDDGQRSKRAAIKNRFKLWTNGVIPYQISSAYSAWQHSVILNAMDHWENHTCIRFVPRTTETAYIQIYPGNGCFSYVGRIGTNQGISVGSSCFAFHTVLHELGHAIGYYHEQSRPDRDDHVDILEQNIIPGQESNFDKKDNSEVDSLGVEYDYNSIMHYDARFFSRNGNPTIVAKDPDIPIGMARSLSALDIEQTKRLYNCPATPPPRQTVAPVPVPERPSFPPELPYPDCGGFISDLSGTIESPGYPEYPHNTDCVWIFILPKAGYNILFDFQPFQVEQSPNCESDYVQVYESVDTSGYRSGKRCGNFYYYPMSSLSSVAYLHFHTNGSNETPNLKGFRLNYYAYDLDECHPSWKICSHGCTNLPGGFECSCPEGFFLSSDGLNCFDVNECGLDKGGCEYKCVNEAGSYHCACPEGFTLDHRNNRSCIAEGEDRCATNNGGCAHTCSVSGNSALCSCRSGYELASDGTSCSLIDPCATNNGGCEHICTSSGNSRVCSCRAGYQLDSTDSSSCNDINECASNGGKGDCDHVCTNTNGSRLCSCPVGYQLQVNGRTCEDIDECKVNNGGCGEVHCINNEGSFECGCEEGSKLVDGNKCASILRGPSGKLRSDNWPQTYPNNVDTQWVIECGVNQLVNLSFSSPFGLAGRLPDCTKDWLKVYDGDSTSAKLLGKLCHFDIPEVPQSSTNSLLLHFYAGPSHSSSRRGFELSYTCWDVPVTAKTIIESTPSELPAQPTQCGQTLFTASTGTIESPNWPETYPNDLTCEYFIQLPNEHQTIEITFKEGFGMAGNLPDCSKDWVKIYDGHTDDSTLFGTYCHFTEPPLTNTSGSKAKIVMYAGPNHSPSRKGFSATYTAK